MKKDAEHSPFLLSGCQVMEGVGKMLVIAVGPHSENGRTLSLLQKATAEVNYHKSYSINILICFYIL